MNIEITREDIINMILGVQPYYDKFDHWFCKKYGFYSGTHDRWSWVFTKSYMKLVNQSGENLTNEELYKVYQEIK